MLHLERALRRPCISIARDQAAKTLLHLRHSQRPVARWLTGVTPHDAGGFESTQCRDFYGQNLPQSCRHAPPSPHADAATRSPKRTGRRECGAGHQWQQRPPGRQAGSHGAYVLSRSAVAITQTRLTVRCPHPERDSRTKPLRQTPLPSGRQARGPQCPTLPPRNPLPNQSPTPTAS